jgi:hypothetical protein
MAGGRHVGKCPIAIGSMLSGYGGTRIAVSGARLGETRCIDLGSALREVGFEVVSLAFSASTRRR